MLVLVGLGEKLAERFLPLYLLALGGGAFSVGLLNVLTNLLNALYSFPGGYASDRLGHKRALLLFNLIAIAGYAIVAAVPHWTAVIGGSVLFISWSAISLPATMDIVATTLPVEKRTMGVSMHSLVRRIPMAVGPLLGGALIGAFGVEAGIRWSFLAAIVLAVVSIGLQQAMIADGPGSGATGGPGSAGASSAPAAPRTYGLSLLTPALRRLLLPDILIRFCEQIPYAFVVVWCVTVNRITPFEFGVLTAVEMATAMIVYLPVAWMADRSTKKPFVLITFGFFTLFPLVLMLADSFGLMVVAFVVRGLKEFGEPTRKALIMDLAPEGRKAATFGLYYLLRDVVVSAAAFGGAVLWDPSTSAEIVEWMGAGEFLRDWMASVASPAANFLTAFAFGLAGTICFAIFGRDLGGKREPQP